MIIVKLISVNNSKTNELSNFYTETEKKWSIYDIFGSLILIKIRFHTNYIVPNLNSIVRCLSNSNGLAVIPTSCAKQN